MGASHAITLGETNPLVKQVFAVSAAYGKDILADLPSTAVFERLHHTRHLTQREASDMASTLPFAREKCQKSNASKYFLVHDRHDGLVPFSEFEANKAHLCLPDENTLVFTRTSHIGKWAHSFPFYKKETFDFIVKNIKK
jgi:hypothetical protein